MNCKTLMLHMTLGQPNAGLLDIAGDLARRLEAQVIGVAACQPLQMVYGDGYVDGTVFDQDRQQLTQEMAELEAEFRAAMTGQGVPMAWRSTLMFAPIADYLARQARSADLVITGLAPPDQFDASRSVDSGELVMQTGRPVLLVPADLRTLALDRVLVGWTDTRETRRAVADALPLLKLAGRVTVIEIAPEADRVAARERLDDVAGWLERHGVTAQTFVTPSTGNDSQTLQDIAGDENSDLLVAGAYGHSRLREWMLGGVTRDLLLRSPHCTLVSH